jgi:cytochrome c peroxidase
MTLHDVGTKGALDQRSQFDTPSLTELWRTAPFLHDGQAANLKEMLTTCNLDQKHGKTDHLTDAEIDDLVIWLLSL